MRKYYLLTVTQTGPDLNPGSHFITHGIRHLIHLADPEALCFEASLFNYHEKHWKVIYGQADAVFLCGNPRYDRSNVQHFWVSDIWQYFQKAQVLGIRTGDLFAGAASPLPLETVKDDVKKLLSYPRNRETVKAQAGLDLLVTRDRVAAAIAKTVNAGSALLPCSTWWARNWLRVDPLPRVRNAIVVPSLNCTPQLVMSLAALEKGLPNNLPTYLVAHCANEFEILRGLFPKHPRVITLSDPLSLMIFLAGCSHVVSARLHATIPALSLGAHVFHVAVDGRSVALEQFGLRPTACAQILSGNFAVTWYRVPENKRPSPDPFVNLFRERISSRITKERGAI